MPNNNNQYINNVYQALSDHLDKMPSLSDFTEKMGDPEYRKKAYAALKDNVSGFNRTYEDFGNKVVDAIGENNAQPSIAGMSYKTPSSSQIPKSSHVQNLPSMPAAVDATRTFATSHTSEDVDKNNQYIQDANTVQQVMQAPVNTHQINALKANNVPITTESLTSLKNASIDNAAVKQLNAKGIYNPSQQTIAQQKQKVQQDLNNGNLTMSIGNDGKMNVGTPAGFVDGLTESIANTLYDAGQGVELLKAYMTGDDAAKQHIINQMQADREYIANHPYASLGALLVGKTEKGNTSAIDSYSNGQDQSNPDNLVYNTALSGAGKFVGNTASAFAPLAIPGAGETELAENGLLSALAKNTLRMIGAAAQNYVSQLPERVNALYQENLQKAQEQGVDVNNQQVKEALANKSLHDAAVQGLLPAAVNGAFFSGAFGGGALTEPLSQPTKEGFADAFSNYLKNSAKFAGVNAGQGAADNLVKKLQGYKTNATDDILNAVPDAFVQTAFLEMLPHITKLPGYLGSQIQNLAQHVDPFMVQNTISDAVKNGTINDADGQKILTGLSNYSNTAKQLDGIIPDEKMPTVAGLTTKINNNNSTIQSLEASKAVLPSSVHSAIDENINSIKNQNEALNQRIGEAMKSSNPLDVEYDDQTGDKVVPGNVTVQKPEQGNKIETASNVSVIKPKDNPISNNKTEENATQKSNEQQPESGKQSSIGEREGTVQQRDETEKSPTNNSNSRSSSESEEKEIDDKLGNEFDDFAKEIGVPVSAEKKSGVTVQMPNDKQHLGTTNNGVTTERTIAPFDDQSYKDRIDAIKSDADRTEQEKQTAIARVDAQLNKAKAKYESIPFDEKPYKERIKKINTDKDRTAAEKKTAIARVESERDAAKSEHEERFGNGQQTAVTSPDNTAENEQRSTTEAGDKEPSSAIPAEQTAKRDNKQSDRNSIETNKGAERNAKPTKILGKRAKQTIKSPLYKKALDIEDGSPNTQALQYFISGGKIDANAIKELFGNKKGEHDARIGLLSKDAPRTVDALAHSLWDNSSEEIQNKYDSHDFKNAVEDVLRNHNSRSSMANELVDNLTTKEQEYHQGLEDEYSTHKEERESDIDHSVFILEGLSDEEIQKIVDEEKRGKDSDVHIDNLIDQHEKEQPVKIYDENGNEVKPDENGNYFHREEDKSHDEQLQSMKDIVGNLIDKGMTSLDDIKKLARKKLGVAPIYKSNPEMLDNLVDDAYHAYTKENTPKEVTSGVIGAVAKWANKHFGGKLSDKVSVLANTDSIIRKANELSRSDEPLINYAAEFAKDSDLLKDNNGKAIGVKPEVLEEMRKERQKIVEDAKADGTYMKAPNGEHSKLNEEQWVTVRTSRFKKWFGDWENNSKNSSKVVDENGEPLVVYHGTNNSFDEFKASKSTGTHGESDQLEGMYFTDNREVAKWYSDYSNVKDVFLNIKKPYISERVRTLKNELNSETQEGISKKLEEKGFDGIFLDVGFQTLGEQKLYLAFNSKEIKSADNNSGTFSKETGNINYHLEQGANQPIYDRTEFHYNKDGKILGFTHGGKIYLNGEYLNPNTPIHEAGHLWLEWTKTNNPEQYARGLKIADGSRYYKKVSSSDFYKKEALIQGTEGSDAYNSYLKHEALAMAIGDKGAQFVSESRTKMFREWLNKLWTSVKNAAGFKDVTNQQLQKMTFEEFTKRAAADILKAQDEPSVSESSKSSGRNAGVSHEALNETAKRIGLPEIKPEMQLTPEEYANRGRKLIAGGVNAEEVLNSNAPLHDKISVARAHLEELINKADAIADKNSTEYLHAQKSIDDYTKNVVKKLGNEWSQAGMSLQGSRDLDTDSFTAVSTQIRTKQNKELSPAQKETVDKLTKQNQQLKKRVSDYEKRLTESVDKELGENKNTESNTDSVSKKSYTQRAKEVADNFRKLKSKPLTFKDANGNEMPVMIQGFSWNDLVEIGAKAIEKTGQIADGVSAIIDKLKDTDWYTSLSDKDKNNFHEQLSNHFENESANTPEAKRIARLEKQRDDLQHGIYKNYTSKKLNPTPEQQAKMKELEDEISDLKERLGVIRSNMEKPLTEQEIIEEDKRKLTQLQEMFAGKADNKFSPEEAKAIWNYAKKNYLNRGTSYSDMISLVGDDLGLTFDQMNHAIITPKNKPMSNSVWKIQNELARSRANTNRYIDEQGGNEIYKNVKKALNLFREVAVFGHGGIFIGTHAMPTLFDLPRAKYTVQALFDAYKLAYGKSETYHLLMQDLKNSPNYILAQRSGLQNNPDRIGSDEELSGTHFLKWFSKSGERGFNAIKILRQKLFDVHYNALDAAEKLDPNIAKSIAQLINNATGATNFKVPNWLNEATFAGGMELSRWERLTRNPAKASKVVFNVLTGQKDKVKPEDRIFAKIWAKRVGSIAATYTGLLGINYALQSQHTDDKKKQVNLTRPWESDFYKFKIGDIVVDPTSGVVSSARYLATLAHIGLEEGKDVIKNEHSHNRLEAIAKKTATYSLGKLSPLYTIFAEQVLRHDYEGNTLPYSDDKPYTHYNRKLTWTEYMTSKLPLPVAEGFGIYYESAHSKGMTQSAWDSWGKAVSFGTLSGTTGLRVYEQGDNSNKKNEDGETPHHHNSHRINHRNKSESE